MDEAELKAKLERALHKPAGAIRPPTWKRLFERYGKEYLRELEGIHTGIDWEELKRFAKEELEYQDEMELELSEPRLEPSGEPSHGEASSSQPSEVEFVSPVGLSNRTKARGRALSELRALVSGLYGEVSRVHPIKSRVRLRRDLAGVPGRWVALLEIEGWVPPEDVARVYRNVRRQMIDEEDSKTEEGTFELARFVWREQGLNDGERPKWPTLFKRWNQQHPDRRFKTFNGFRQCCVRGMKATIPRYKEFPDLKPPPEDVRRELREREQRMIEKLKRFAELHGGDTPFDAMPLANSNRLDSELADANTRNRKGVSTQ